jgi:hypothetical protein
MNLVEGWTEEIDYTLKAQAQGESSPSAVDLTDMTVAIVAKYRDGTAISLSGQTSVTDAANGQVRFAPAANDIQATDPAPTLYLVRFKVTDSGSKISYFPNGEAEKWYVRK